MPYYSTSQHVDDFATSVVSKHSQYSVGSKSACSVIASEMSLALLHLQTINAKEQFLDKVLLNCSNFKCEHLDVQDILKDCRRFNLGLRVIDVKQMSIHEFEYELGNFVFGHRAQMPFSLILTKPPETVALICLSESNFLFFDSHPRKRFNGAYLVHFQCLKSVKRWLGNYYASETVDSMTGVEGLLINTIEMVAVQSTETLLKELPSIDEFKAVLEMAKKKDEIIQKQREQINDLSRELSVCKSELSTLKANSERGMTLLYEKAKEMANKSIRNANKNLNAIEDLKNEILGSETAVTLVDLPCPKVKVETFVCLLCNRSNSVESVFRLESTGCNHSMCRQCAAEYFKTQAGQNKFPIKCPLVTCQSVIHMEDFSLVLQDIELLTKINDRQYHHHHRRW